MLIELRETKGKICVVCNKPDEQNEDLKLGQSLIPLCLNCQHNLEQVLAAARVIREQKPAETKVSTVINLGNKNTCHNPPKFLDKACGECKFFSGCEYEKKGA